MCEETLGLNGQSLEEVKGITVHALVGGQMRKRVNGQMLIPE